MRVQKSANDVVLDGLEDFVDTVVELKNVKKDYDESQNKMKALIGIIETYNTIIVQLSSKKHLVKSQKIFNKISIALCEEISFLLKHDELPLNDHLGLIELRFKLKQIMTGSTEKKEVILN